VSYANMDGVPTQTEGVSEILADDWNTYVRDNFDSIKFGHLVVANDGVKSALSVDEGTMVYQEDNQKVFVYSGTSWVEVNDLGNTGASSDAAIAALSTPTGIINPFAGSSAPSGWLLCYGQSLNGTSNPAYAALYNVIGTTYGGSSISAFNVPDLRGRAVAGRDIDSGGFANRLTGSGITGTQLGSAGGTATHILTEAQLAAHTHTINHDHGVFGTTDGAGSHRHGVRWRNNVMPTTGAADVLVPTSTGLGAVVGSAEFPDAGGHNHSIDVPNFNGSSGSKGNGTAHLNTQPTIVLNYIIKL